MPRLKCLCGESVSLHEIPNPQGFKLIWELAIETFINEIVSAHQRVSTKDFEKQVYDTFYLRNPEFPQMYECPRCGRLAVFARASDNKPALWFHPEDTNPMRLRSLLEE